MHIGTIESDSLAELDVRGFAAAGRAGDSNSGSCSLLLIEVGKVRAAALGVSQGEEECRSGAGLLTQAGAAVPCLIALAARSARLLAGRIPPARRSRCSPSAPPAGEALPPFFFAPPSGGSRAAAWAKPGASAGRRAPHHLGADHGVGADITHLAHWHAHSVSRPARIRRMLRASRSGRCGGGSCRRRAGAHGANGRPGGQLGGDQPAGSAAECRRQRIGGWGLA